MPKSISNLSKYPRKFCQVQITLFQSGQSFFKLCQSGNISPNPVTLFLLFTVEHCLYTERTTTIRLLLSSILRSLIPLCSWNPSHECLTNDKKALDTKPGFNLETFLWNEILSKRLFPEWTSHKKKYVFFVFALLEHVRWRWPCIGWFANSQDCSQYYKQSSIFSFTLDNFLASAT